MIEIKYTKLGKISQKTLGEIKDLQDQLEYQKILVKKVETIKDKIEFELANSQDQLAKVLKDHKVSEGRFSVIIEHIEKLERISWKTVVQNLKGLLFIEQLMSKRQVIENYDKAIVVME